MPIEQVGLDQASMEQLEREAEKGGLPPKNWLPS